jgi:hypothetical protein
MRVQRAFVRPGYDYGVSMRRAGLLTRGAVVALVLSGCGGGSSPQAEPDPSPSISTLTPLPMPDLGPPAGELVADLRQASRDAALNRFQVWIGNGLRHEINPTSIRYLDPRFRAPIPGQRLRANPPDGERGYPLALPARPRCDVRTGAAPGSVAMAFEGRRVRIPVEDEADVVARYVASRCLELAVSQVAELSFADQVPVDGSGEGSTGTLVLVARPTGRAGTVLTVETVGGTPVLTAQGSSVWRPRVRVRGDGPVRRIELPVVPNRCDDHAFLEAGGATAFIVHLRLGRESGDLVIRMSDEGARNAIRFARDSCGLE